MDEYSSKKISWDLVVKRKNSDISGRSNVHLYPVLSTAVSFSAFYLFICTSPLTQFSDLFILMDLLTNLLNKDVVDFWSVDENSNASGADGSTQVRVLTRIDTLLNNFHPDWYPVEVLVFRISKF